MCRANEVKQTKIPPIWCMLTEYESRCAGDILLGIIWFTCRDHVQRWSYIRPWYFNKSWLVSSHYHGGKFLEYYRMLTVIFLQNKKRRVLEIWEILFRLKISEWIVSMNERRPWNTFYKMKISNPGLVKTKLHSPNSQPIASVQYLLEIVLFSE